MGWLDWALEEPKQLQWQEAPPEPLATGAAPSKQGRFETATEAAVPGMEEEGAGARRVGGNRSGLSSRQKSYMTPKGKASRGYAAMTERDDIAEREARRADTARRNTARRSARRTEQEAKLRPLITSRPKPQRWQRQPDDWRREASSGVIQHTDDLWKLTDQELRAGLPMQPQLQHKDVYGSQREMTEKERVYQLESQMASRERKRIVALKEKKKEALAADKLEQDKRGIEWYHRQRERHEKGLQKGERKEVQSRLYAVPARSGARVYG